MTAMTRRLTIIIIAFVAVTTVMAQRRVTPVVNQATKTQSVNLSETKNDTIRPASVVEMVDASGRKFLMDTIAGTEWVDSLPATRQIPRMEQPLLFAVAVSADIATPLMRAFGQHYGIAEFAAELNLHNRYMPVIEIGLGQSDYHPDNNNYHYHTGVTPFFRLGMNYGFLYNSNPDYMFVAGLRYGLSPFSFNVTDVTQNPDAYWGPGATFDIPSQHVTVGYLQFLLGLRVKIIGPVSLGWTVRYQTILHQSATPYGEPWYIPGYGSRGNALSFTFSITYTFRLGHNRQQRADEPGLTNNITP